MNETYNNETITAYLLGSLPDEQAEIFDELSFTDDKFAEELKAAEKDLVDAYVNNELRGSTLEQFKSFYLASPLRREKVEFARTFQGFAGEKLQDQTSDEREKISDVEKKQKPKFFGFVSALNVFTTSRPSLQWGFAVLALIFMGLAAWLIFENSRLQNQFSAIEARRIELQQREKQLQDEINGQRYDDLEKERELSNVRTEIARLEKELEQKRVVGQEQDQKRIAQPEVANVKKQTPEPRRQIIASLVLTPQMRGTDQWQTLTISEKIDSVAMRLELESDDFPNYRVALKNPSNGQTLWQSGKLRLRGNEASKFLSVGFPSKILNTQIYTLEVSGISAAGTAENISSYSFRVVR